MTRRSSLFESAPAIGADDELEGAGHDHQQADLQRC